MQPQVSNLCVHPHVVIRALKMHYSSVLQLLPATGEEGVVPGCFSLPTLKGSLLLPIAEKTAASDFCKARVQKAEGEGGQGCLILW